MKKTSVLVKQVLMSTLTAGIFAFGFTACSDELDSEAMNNAVTPLELSSGCGLENLEQHSYAVPYMVSAKGDWKISFRFKDGRQICYAHPNHGHGSQQVKICVLDNWTDERRSGEMTITDSEDPQHPQVISLEQKCNLDNRITRGANGGLQKLTLGNRIYGVGYGYNMYMPLKECIGTTPIIRLEEFKDSNIFFTEGVDMKEHYIEATGSTFHELTNNFGAKANGSGKYNNFSGEVSAAFKCSDFSSNKFDYSLCTVDIVKTKAMLTADRTKIIYNYMTDEAYYNINGLPMPEDMFDGERTMGSGPVYPSTPEGLYALVKNYGTHLVMRTEMGGRLTFASAVDVSKISGSYDINAFAKLSYEGSAVNASISAEDEYKNSFTSNADAIDTKVNAYGGTNEAASQVTDASQDKINTWKETLNKVENCKVVGVDKATLIPLWDLVNPNVAGAEARRAAIRQFIENDLYTMMQQDDEYRDNNAYEYGTVARITIPTFPGTQHPTPNTLIKDVYMSGTHVARICSEYLPQIKKDSRVTVVYPVVGNNVKYNLGYYVGDDAHKPCRVCCTDNDITVREISGEKNGEKKEVYLRGSSFYSQEKDAVLLDGEAKGNTTVKDTYMTGLNYSKEKGEYSYNYPIVKIFSRLWLRTSYGERIPDSDCGQRNGFYGWYGQFNKIRVNNWRLALWNDYENLLDGLKKGGITLPASVMFNGYNAEDLTGFNVQWNGWMVNGKNNNAVGHMEYLSKEKTTGPAIGHVRIKDGGSVEIVKHEFSNEYQMEIRLALPVSMQK